MSDRIRCTCRRCTIRGLMGPAVVVTVGVLLLLDQIRGGYYSFGNTWPVILVVVGVIMLVCAMAPMEGHISGRPGPPMPPAPPGTTAPPQQGSAPGQGQ